MQLTCTLCDQTTNVDDSSQEARKYENHPLLLYICPPCNDSIGQKTKERLARRAANRSGA